MPMYVPTSLPELMQRLSVRRYPHRWEGFFAEAVECMQQDGNPLLHPEHYQYLQAQYGVLPDFLEIYQNAAAEVAKIPELALFFTLLCRALRDRDQIQKDISCLEMPQAPAGQLTLPYDMLTALSMLQSVPDNYAELIRRGVPEADRDFALRAPEFNVTGGVLKGRPCLEHFDYYQKAYDCRLHRFGRLEYEFPKFFDGAFVFGDARGNKVLLANGQTFHKSGQVLGTRGFSEPEGAFIAGILETDTAFAGFAFDTNGCAGSTTVTLPKTQWKLMLKPGDPVVGIHIPGGYVHGPLTEEKVSDSLQQAREVLQRCYSDYGWKAFFCHSWMIDPTVGDLLPEGSNLHSFNRRFAAFGAEPCSGESVYDYVFGAAKSVLPADLPANSTLQKQIKNWYVQGGIIRDMHGIILK